MTTMHIQDIVHKKSVPTRYAPNSYRIFCEDIGNQSIPDEKKYSSQAPQLYTQPMILPAQAIEDRNKPHGGRAADFLRENAHTLNEPVNKVRTRNVTDDNEKKWWQWDAPKEEDWKAKRRSQSSSNYKETSKPSSANGLDAGYQTTYQKDHGYLTELKRSESGTRHGYNPNASHAVGIVPITDLTSYSKANEPQRVFVDKVSFEQAYDSRNENNYPMRGRRHGAFVIEQEYPKPVLGTKSRPDQNKGTSVWDAMHPNLDAAGNAQPKSHVFSKPPSGKPEVLQNIRRDPIGYFEDTKFGSDPAESHNQNGTSNGYHPSWNSQDDNQYENLRPNELLDNAMKYQQ